MAREDGDGPQTSVSSQFIEIRADLQGINYLTSLKKAFVALRQMLFKQTSLPRCLPLLSFKFTSFMVLIGRSV